MTAVATPASPLSCVAARIAAPIAWVLHDGKAGMQSQALGLAEATGFCLLEKPLDIRRPWSVLPPQLWPLSRCVIVGGEALLGPPWPAVVIGCGRNAVIPALAIRRASGGRTILAQVQDPRLGRAEFDLLIVPEHDRLRGRQVFVSAGAIHRV
ncbi:MAG TPA: ELM1/GtrOC1 family putative glycosyltransferase, partial [Stellaceae bacterium]